MGKRPYRMRARAEAAEATTKRVLDAALALFTERPFPEVTLRTIAERSGVSLPTVMRKFGSKERLFEVAANEFSDDLMRSRRPVRPCDVPAAIRRLCDSYEAMGDLGWRGLTQEDLFPWVRKRMDGGRRLHRAWVEESFAHLLDGLPKKQRERRVLLLFAATDFYVWKLYRRDLGLSRAVTVARMVDLATAAGEA